jgi:CRISPR-associated protein Cas5t
MLTLHVEVPYGSFRKSYARSLAETYPLPPPATVYGMLLSLVGEGFRRRHVGVRLALAFSGTYGDRSRRHSPFPRVAQTLRKLSRYKYYGKASKQSKQGNRPDYIETLCDIAFLCWVDSAQETNPEPRLEMRLREALETPETITRYGVLSLGLSDDAVNDICLVQEPTGDWHRLKPSQKGSLELPVWVDHVGSRHTRWQRYELERKPVTLPGPPSEADWTTIQPPS